MSAPVVSVLMTAYNREKYIADAIESVLASTYSDFELIIVDDGSKDQTVAIARKYELLDARIKVHINESNLGDYPNRNKAASLSSGKYLKYLDSDDMIYPHGLAAFTEWMEKNPSAALGVSSRENLPLYPFPHLLSPRDAYYRHFFEQGLLDFGPSGVIIRKDAFIEAGCFSGKRYVGDQECWLKIAARHHVLELPPSLIYWRRHEGQEFLAGSNGIDGGYFLMTLPMLRDAFSKPDCPLTKVECATIISKQERQYARSIVKHILKTGQLTKALQRKKELNIPLTAIF